MGTDSCYESAVAKAPYKDNPTNVGTCQLGTGDSSDQNLESDFNKKQQKCSLIK